MFSSSLKNTGNPHKPKHKRIYQCKAFDILSSGLLRLQKSGFKNMMLPSPGLWNSDRCFDESTEFSYNNKVYFLLPDGFLSMVLHISPPFYRFSEPANRYGKTENEIFSN